MKLWALRHGIGNCLAFVKHPYTSIHPKPGDWFWHQHICLALRLGPETYQAFCPYAAQREFEPEAADQCDKCSNFVILSSLDRKMHIEGSPDLFDAYNREQGEFEVREEL